MSLRFCVYYLLSIFTIATASARVIRVDIQSRTPILNGKSFGSVGPYEKLIGKVYFAVDPANLHNKIIADLDKAPRNAKGEVEFSSDFYILRPKLAGQGNGTTLVEISNRGGKGAVSFFNRGTSSKNPETDDQFGDGFLMQQGFTVVWIGWQYDVPDADFNLKLFAPVASDAGQVITGLARTDFNVTERTSFTSLGHRGQKAQPVLDADNPQNTMTVRSTVLGERTSIPRSDWGFGQLQNGVIVPDPTSVYLKGGFEPGKIYEVVWQVGNPTVAGLGLAAVRDFVSYLKNEATSVAPTARAIGFGISQSGRYLRHFLYEGFNADEQGRQVFDGVNNHVGGAGMGTFNHRFAEPSRDGTPFYTLFFPVDLFPFTDNEQTDPETGQTDGLLKRAVAEGVAPKLFHTYSSYEYYGRIASLLHTTADGNKDAVLPDNVRIYFFAGSQHFPTPVLPDKQNRIATTALTYQATPNDLRYGMRALLLAMNRWIQEGTQPPNSRYPRIDKGTLVPVEQVKFPVLSGVKHPKAIRYTYRVDYGPAYATKKIITLQPPKVGKPYGVNVPQVDADGNELDGLRMPEVQVPLGTYTGWNTRNPATGAPEQLVDFYGSYFPFAKTKADRTAVNDPRKAILERYKNREEYLDKLTHAANDLVKGGYLLSQDVPSIRQRGEEFWKWHVE